MEAYGKFHAFTYDLSTRFTGYSRAPRRLCREFFGVAGDEKGLKILDFGCGTGLLTKHLLKARPGLDITGVDPSAEMLKVYQAKYPGVKTAIGGYNNGLALADGEYDAILASGVFDHLTIDAPMMKEFLRVVKPGGFVGFTYERNTKNDQMLVHQGEGREFRSYPDSYVSQCMIDGGSKIAHQKKVVPGYVVNGGGFMPHHVKFAIMIAQKPKAVSPQP